MADLEWQLSSHLICDNPTDILLCSSLLEILFFLLQNCESRLHLFIEQQIH